MRTDFWGENLPSDERRALREWYRLECGWNCERPVRERRRRNPFARQAR